MNKHNPLQKQLLAPIQPNTKNIKPGTDTQCSRHFWMAVKVFRLLFASNYQTSTNWEQNWNLPEFYLKAISSLPQTCNSIISNWALLWDLWPTMTISRKVRAVPRTFQYKPFSIPITDIVFTRRIFSDRSKNNFLFRKAIYKKKKPKEKL